MRVFYDKNMHMHMHMPWYSEDALKYKKRVKGENHKRYRSKVKETRGNSFALKNTDFVIGQKR